MAGENRATSDTLTLYRELEEAPWKFDFFQAMRLLEAAQKGKSPRIGASLQPRNDNLRLGQKPSLRFAPATLSEFSSADEKRPAQLQVEFFGLWGPNGPMPLHLTEYAYDRMRNEEDDTLWRFTNIFHHRLLSLFYRAWARGKPTASLDRPDDDYFTHKIASTVGLAEKQIQGRDSLPDFAKYYFAARIAPQHKNAEGLLSIIRSFFSVPVDLQQFIGGWLDIPEDAKLALGTSGKYQEALGLTTTLGARVWECQHKFRLTIGPLSMQDYQRLLPGGSSLPRLTAIIRNYIGDELEWQLNLILKKEQWQPAQLGGFGQLGWTSWLGNTPPEKDPNSLYLNPMLDIV